MRERLTALIARLKRFRHLWLPVTIGLIIIIYSPFALVYFQQQQEQDSLRSQIAQQQTTLQQLPSDEELAAAINNANDALEAARAIFPTDLLQAKVAVLNAIADLSSETRVTHSFTDTDPAPGSETVSGINYLVLEYTVDVQGDYDQVVLFINKLDRGETALKSLLVTRVSNLTRGTTTTASLDFTVYILSGG